MAKTTDPRRFGGTGRVYGEKALEQLATKHVVVVGMGGVGSWCVEALVRAGVGEMTLIDGDVSAVSNTNRQSHAMEGNYDRPKVECVAERMRLINPGLKVHPMVAFVKKDTLESVLPSHPDFVIDCIDDLQGKADLVGYCKAKGINVLVSGGAAARRDPSRITSADLALVKGDPLLAKVRTLLRQQYEFPKGHQDPKRTRKFGIRAVFSDEPLTQPGMDTLAILGCDPEHRPGFGSMMVVTATCGLRLAHYCLEAITQTAES